MIREGQIVLFRFPYADHKEGKLRPALVIRQLPGSYEDWLICMISTQLRHYTPEFDEIIQSNDADFSRTGLKEPSIIRVGRLAVVEGDTLLGAIGEINSNRLQRVKENLSGWIMQS